ncbi:hypothetical protein FRC01_008306 [Tulasnella sp. 417]|nr:hypothetical protein FRC01_008306 [Tulasnella sp. 417]
MATEDSSQGQPKPAKSRAPRFQWTEALIWKLINKVAEEQNRKVLLGKKEKKENTSGDSKTAVYKRIGIELFPDERQATASPKEEKAVDTMLGNRVKSKWENLLGSYKLQAAKMTVTGGGLSLESVDDDQLADALEEAAGVSRLYVPPEGPSQDTSSEARNLWEEINNQFPFFAELHRLIGTRPNMIPISITTGTGPRGSTTIHPQPPSPITTPAANLSSESWDLEASLLPPSAFQSVAYPIDGIPLAGGFLDQLTSGYPQARVASPISTAHSLSSTQTPEPALALNAPPITSTPKNNQPARSTTPATSSASQTSANSGVQKKSKLKKSQPPKQSTLSTEAIRNAAAQKVRTKRGLEEVLLGIHRENAEAVASRAEAEVQLKKSEQAFAFFKAGLITREEFRNMAGFEGAPPSKKRRSNSSGTSLSTDLDFDGPGLGAGESDSTGLEENEDEDSEAAGEGRAGSEEPGEDLDAEYATLYGSLE